MFQPMDVEFSNEHAAAAARDVTFDMGDSLVRVLQSLRTSWFTTVTVFGGGRDNSPILSDGRIGEPRKNPRHYDPNRPKQCVQEFG